MRVLKKKGLYVFLILTVAAVVAISVYVGAKAIEIQRETEELKKMDWVIPLGTYDSAVVISGTDGLYAVEKNKKWGIVNRDRDIILPLKFDGIMGSCDSGLIPVSRGELHGFVDEKGKIAIDLQYDSAFPFEKGYAAVSKNGYDSVIDVKGHEKYTVKIKEGQLYITGKAGYAVSEDLVDEMKDIREMKIIDIKKGKVVFSSNKYSNAGYGEGLWCLSRTGKNRCDFLDDQFRYVFDIADEETMTPFQEGLAVSRDSSYTVKYFNKEGEVVINTEGGVGYDFSEGIACVASHGAGHFIDKKGKTLFTVPGYRDEGFTSVMADPLFQGGYCLWQAKNGEFGYLSKYGEYVVEPIFETAGMVNHGEAAVVYGSESGVLKLPAK